MYVIQECPFCESQAKTKENNGETLFKCTNCPRFLISYAVLKLFAKGEFLDRRPSLLDDIKKSPPHTIPFVRRRSPEGDANTMNDPYVQYQST